MSCIFASCSMDSIRVHKADVVSLSTANTHARLVFCACQHGYIWQWQTITHEWWSTTSALCNTCQLNLQFFSSQLHSQLQSQLHSQLQSQLTWQPVNRMHVPPYDAQPSSAVLHCFFPFSHDQKVVADVDAHA